MLLFMLEVRDLANFTNLSDKKVFGWGEEETVSIQYLQFAEHQQKPYYFWKSMHMGFILLQKCVNNELLVSTIIENDFICFSQLNIPTIQTKVCYLKDKLTCKDRFCDWKETLEKCMEKLFTKKQQIEEAEKT